MSKAKWHPVLISKKLKKTDSKIMQQKLAEISELIYSSFCQPSKTHCFQPKNLDQNDLGKRRKQ